MPPHFPLSIMPDEPTPMEWSPASDDTLKDDTYKSPMVFAIEHNDADSISDLPAEGEGSAEL